MRIERTGTRYFSLEEFRIAMASKPNKTKDNKGHQEKFLNRHKCKACGEPLSWTGGNIMCCKNPECKGIKIKKKDGDVFYLPSYELLDSKGTQIAESLFSVEI